MPHVTLFPLVVLCILKRIHASIQKSPADTHRPSLSPNLSNTPQVVALEDSLLASRLQPPHSSDLTSDYRRHAHTTGTQLPPPSGTTGPAPAPSPGGGGGPGGGSGMAHSGIRHANLTPVLARARGHLWNHVLVRGCVEKSTAKPPVPVQRMRPDPRDPVACASTHPLPSDCVAWPSE